MSYFDHHSPVSSLITTVDDTLKCHLFNARSLNSVDKRSALEIFLAFHNSDVVCITETWLRGELCDSLLVNSSTHSIFRKDRGSRGGGVSRVGGWGLEVGFLGLYE